MIPLFDKASRPVMLEAKAFLLDFRPRLRLGLLMLVELLRGNGFYVRYREAQQTRQSTHDSRDFVDALF